MKAKTYDTYASSGDFYTRLVFIVKVQESNLNFYFFVKNLFFYAKITVSQKKFVSKLSHCVQ